MPEEVAIGGAFTRLLSPFAVGRVKLRNRIVFQPHFTALGHTDGMPSDEHVAYHEERARGGVGLIVFESQAVHPTGKMSRRFVNAWDPAIVPRMAKVADAVHRHGAKLFGQLTHGGHTSLERPPPIMWAPTQMSEPSSYHSTKAMDEDDIRAVIAGFAASARNLVDAGLDGVEIKIAHDGLLRSFASPFFNRRTDRYGGSFENRMRLCLEVVDAIKKATGPEVPLGVRMCVNEFTIFGYDEEYGLRMAATLEATSQVDYFNSDAGSFSSFWMEIPPAAVAANDFRKINAVLKKASRIPVIAFGRLAPTAAEALLAAGEADLIGMARPLIADPEIPNKLMAGRGDLIRVCVACNDACVYQAGQEKALRCIHNPGAGRERTMSERLVTVAPKRKRIVVAGGGPAGLKVAEVAARRGHHVTLLERANRLGGQVLLAAVQPEHDTIGEVTAYLEAMTVELGVTIKVGTEATVESIRAFSPDTVVVATGSEPNLPGLVTAESDRSRSLGLQILPEIEGLDRENVVSCDDVLSGHRELSGGVLVVDQNGHWEAAGTAEFLADAGCRVTVIATHSVIGENLEDGGRTLFFRRAAIKGITLRPETALVAVEEGKVRLSAVFSGADAVGWGKYLLMPGDDEVLEGIDFVVPVIGRRSREALFLDLKASPDFSSIRVERVGDCVAPRLIQMTISEAFELTRDL
jgi:2,4-dienoyl-CoA reductase-like NADH-dependent reductase (Old Yellow Enzyme family)/pyruvate/2-oxoglutarate dehydrogenase complex dihydrolipoamide dehydrogenase (E3) component